MSLRLFPPESSSLTKSVWKLILASPLATINIQTEIVNGERRLFFFGARIWLRMTFNYPVTARPFLPGAPSHVRPFLSPPVRPFLPCAPSHVRPFLSPPVRPFLPCASLPLLTSAPSSRRPSAPSPRTPRRSFSRPPLCLAARPPLPPVRPFSRPPLPLSARPPPAAFFFSGSTPG